MRQAELISVLDQHQRGVGDVNSNLHHTGGQQYLQLTAGKLSHDRILFLRSQSAMQNTYGVGGKFPREAFGFGVDGLDAGSGVFIVHSRENHVGLPTGCQFLFEKIQNARPAIGRAHVCAQGAPTGGHLVEHGAVEIAVQGEAEGSRNGRGGHRQQVGILALAQELVALGDTELVLLIDHHQAHALLVKAFLKQRVGANDDRGLVPMKERFSCFLVAAGVKAHTQTEGLKPLLEISVVLFG